MTKGCARAGCHLAPGLQPDLDATGNLVRSVTKVKRGDRIHTRVTDGAIQSNVA